MSDWLKVRLGIALDQDFGGNEGFKSIQSKSIHFKSARFRESLMEIAMLCSENSLSDFVESQYDIKQLFYSMSPAVAAFLQDGFSETKFTKKIANLDWQLDRKIMVLGAASSVIT